MTNSRFIYWKAEHRKFKWILIPDTDEAKKGAIGSGAMFFTTTSLSTPYQNNGNPEPHRWGDFCFDFDSDDIRIALTDLRTLFLSHLPQTCGIDPHKINFFLSGGKGFHAVIPASLCGTEEGDPRLPIIYKQIAAKWKNDLKLKSLDLCLYCMGKGRMFRIPNVKRANGNYKVPLLLDEVRTADPEELIRLANKPRILESY